ncbi:Sporulation protein YlmC, PRC-barrel domain family [Methanophagales archaeon]|nr:Sporulation protein YlmC, PRC-barrel domain family [Methanophagales archaeon]
MWKRKDKEGKEKVIAYLRSRLFPWNFVFEDVEADSVEHFVPYAIQVCEGKGINKKAIGGEVLKEVITREVREAVNDYLFDPGDKEIVRIHGKFMTTYPFAFSQCLVYTILYRLGLNMGEVLDLNAVSDLLGTDVERLRDRDVFINDLIVKNEKKALKLFGKDILDRKVITVGGDYVGQVDDIIFDIDKGDVEGLLINHRKGMGLEKSKISMNDVRLNMYTKNISLKHSNYNKK